MLNITRQISQFNHYNYNNPKFIILHYVGAQGSTAKNNADYFCGGDRQASAHYFVDDNSIYQIVEDNKGAWHIGNSNTEPNNTNSIGIEMCCLEPNVTVSEQTEANAIDLVKYLMRKYSISIENVRTHAEVTSYSKICPNWSANNWERWRNFKSKLGGQTVSQPINPPVTPSQPQVTPSNEYETKRWNETGIATFTQTVGVFNNFTDTSAVDYYYKGESANYDLVVETNLYRYISYISKSGIRRYVPIYQYFNKQYRATFR